MLTGITGDMSKVPKADWSFSMKEHTSLKEMHHIRGVTRTMFVLRWNSSHGVKFYCNILRHPGRFGRTNLKCAVWADTQETWCSVTPNKFLLTTSPFISTTKGPTWAVDVNPRPSCWAVILLITALLFCCIQFDSICLFKQKVLASHYHKDRTQTSTLSVAATWGN